MRTEHNYWLHRGSLEVEQGSLDLAENFLNQARARAGSDMNVQTEYGYLLFRKALQNPAASHATEYVAEATNLLKAKIAARGAKDPHAYHVLGNNMLEWIDRGIYTYEPAHAPLARIFMAVGPYLDGSRSHGTPAVSEGGGFEEGL